MIFVQIAGVREPDVERQFDRVITFIRAIRNLRAEYRMNGERMLSLTVMARDDADKHILQQSMGTIARLAKAQSIFHFTETSVT